MKSRVEKYRAVRVEWSRVEYTRVSVEDIEREGTPFYSSLGG
jgi:hypothetical protein